MNSSDQQIKPYYHMHLSVSFNPNIHSDTDWRITPSPFHRLLLTVQTSPWGVVTVSTYHSTSQSCRGSRPYKWLYFLRTTMVAACYTLPLKINWSTGRSKCPKWKSFSLDFVLRFSVDFTLRKKKRSHWANEFSTTWSYELRSFCSWPIKDTL